MARHASRIDKIVRAIIVCLFLVVGFYGFFNSITNTIAQSNYVKAKYGVSFPLLKSEPLNADTELFDLHYQTNSKYPHNYFFHAYVAREAINQAYLVAGAIYGNKESLKAIEQLYNKYDSEDSDSKMSLNDLYVVLANKALFFAKLAVDTNPYYEENRLVYKEALLLCGKQDEAIEFWEKIVDLEYWNRFNHDVMAELYLESGNYTMAIKERKHVANSALKNKLQGKFSDYKREARKALANAKQTSKKLDLDIEVFNKALSSSKLLIDIDPYDSESQKLYKDALVVCGQLDDAIAYWEGVVNLDVSNKGNHAILAELYLKAGDIFKAVNELPYVSDENLKSKLEKCKKILDKHANKDSLNE